MRKKQITKNTQGFTLMEVLISMAIVGIIVTMVLWADKQRIGILSKGNKTSQAIRLIEQQIEDKRIGIRATKVLPDANTTTSQTISGITLNDTVKSAYDIKGVLLTNVRTYIVAATWPQSKDTIRIQTFITKDF